MLNEESFHLLTGLTGFQRIIRAGKVPVEIMQKVLNHWLPVCFDLFGHERSRGAGRAYLWGLKGRFNEDEAGAMKDPQSVNELARQQYYKEVKGLIELLNKDVGEGKPKLAVPDLRFRRSIGEHKGQRFSVTGKALDEEAYNRHLQEVLPTEADRKKLREITQEQGWIAEAA